jgi:hypothetical protein
MRKERIFRSYDIERDKDGMPCRLLWLGDFKIPPKPTKEEVDQQRLQEWESAYGKRDAE